MIDTSIPNMIDTWHYHFIYGNDFSFYYAMVLMVIIAEKPSPCVIGCVIGYYLLSGGLVGIIFSGSPANVASPATIVNNMFQINK
jgi:hypothetical protein